ncbi:SLBB domain-containing protein [Bacteroidia bacterium]|nr:SLBB domain-containing protein [Bacteroidia bacterium]
MKKLVFLFTVLLVNISLHAQLPIGKTQVSDFSDSEIRNLIQKAEQTGMSESQMLQLAKARGMSQSDIDAFRKRAENVQNKQLPNDEIKVESKDLSKKKSEFTNTKTTIKEAQKPITPDVIKPNITDISKQIYTSWNKEELFNEKRFPSFENGRSLRAPDNYIIGVGDDISVTVFGNDYFNQVSKVDSRGRIDLGTALGKIYVKGIEYRKLDKLITSVLRNKINLRGNQVEVDLAFSRQQSISVTGEVKRPGTYQIPAANTIFNLLVLSGGPTNNGSLRIIDVIRGGKVVYTFDTYQYLLDPKNNIFLEDGDFVVIKPVQSKVKLNGGVNRPGLIELTNGETLNDAVKYAGGFSTKSDPTRITLSRLDGTRRSLLPVNFNESKTELFDGDELFVFQQREEIFNGIEIEGEVYFPGKYSLGENETIKTFIEKSGGLTEKANSEFAFVIRTYQDGTVDYLKTNLDGSTSSNFELKYNDKIVVFSKDYFKDDFTVEIKGEVRNPQSIPYRKGLTLQSLIDYAGGFKYSADQTQIKILRSEVFDSTFTKGNLNRTKRIFVKVSKIGGTYKVENEFLQPTDIVTVGRVSNLDDRVSVSITGEVLHPGIHVFPKGLNSVNDLLEEVGGFTEFAYPEGATLIRSNGDQVLFELSKEKKLSDYNYKLITGDQIVIPTRPDVVKLYYTDSLLNKQYFVAPHIGGRAGKYYRQFSLGFNKDFRKRDLYSNELGGRISRSKNFGVFVLTPKVKPGSELLFKSQKTKSKKQKEELDWNKFFENLTTKLTALATLWVLTNQL